jgi:AcrR family transcriptional regulator
MQYMIESLRERKKHATRSALRRAATRLIAKRGLHEVTVEEIAAEANVSARTFFNYFPSKEDAVIGWDPDRLEELRLALADRDPSLGAVDALRGVLVERLASFDADSDELLERLELLRSDPRLIANQAARWAETERALVEVLAKRRGSDSRRDEYAALVVATEMAASRVAMLAWCERGGREPLRDVLTAHLNALAEGLPEPPTNARLK